MGHLGILLTSLGLLLFLLLKAWEVFLEVVLRPHALTRSLRMQGVKGPTYKLFSGSNSEIKALKEVAGGLVLDVQSHDLTPRILPHYHKWSSLYGGMFLYWLGTIPRICITDIEMVKQILLNKTGFFVKDKQKPVTLTLLGRGLILLDGSEWLRHRRVVSPAFTMDKLKLMAEKMVSCTLSMLDMWQAEVMKAKTQFAVLDMDGQFQELTANVICHTAFGKSYAEGKEVFHAQRELQVAIMESFLKIEIPGFRYLPTKQNRRRKALDRKMKETLSSIIQCRLDNKSSGYGKDLLGLMLEACDDSSNTENLKLEMHEIIDECKTFFFAGQETTSHLLTWTMFLLGSNLEWQDKLRDEVLRECGMGVPDADIVGKLKMLNMVLLEVLRLYCPIVVMIRMAQEDVKLANVQIPKNTNITIPLPIIHRSKELWGDDAMEFNPMRFENGTSAAAEHPNALLAFSLGPRACVGQSFAMVEAKIVLSMILQRFSFVLSSEYKHAPAHIVTLQPQFGVPIVLTSIKA